MLVVGFCKPDIQKLKSLGGGKLEYYKPIGPTTRKGEPNFEISVGEEKKKRERGGGHNFWLKCSGKNSWRKLWMGLRGLEVKVIILAENDIFSS